MSEIKESEPEQSEKEILEVFQALRQEVTQIFTKINELENEKAEHTLVIGASRFRSRPLLFLTFAPRMVYRTDR